MFDTAASVAAAVAVGLPGFVIAELSRVGRADRSEVGDLRLVMRALFYALALHVLAAAWTRDLVQRLDDGADWADHVGAIGLYAVVVLIAATACRVGQAASGADLGTRRELFEQVYVNPESRTIEWPEWSTPSGTRFPTCSWRWYRTSTAT